MLPYTATVRLMKFFKSDLVESGLEHTFASAEQSGLKLAIKGRLTALLLIWLYMIASRDSERLTDITTTAAILALLGIIHFKVIGSSWDRKWVKYCFISIDIVLLSAAMVVLPAAPQYDLPQIFIFRFDVFHYYYIIPVVAAFSFSPGLVLWSGLLGSIGWLSAFTWIRGSMTAPLEWTDALAGGTQDVFVNVILNENFAGTGSRIQEAVIYLIVAVLVAVVTFRARQTIRQQIIAERDKHTVSELFGRFVPATIAQSMIDKGGTLAPIERNATVLFVDIAGFTKMTEKKGARETVSTLNAYFNVATKITGENGGIVTQFQGDAILAVFNVPNETDNHAERAMKTATALLDTVSTEKFAGESLRIRIGINSGPVVAGIVGGGGREGYTVHGNTVNLAARLESLNKRYGTPILVSETTAASLNSNDLEKVDDALVDGVSGQVGVYTLSRYKFSQ